MTILPWGFFTIAAVILGLAIKAACCEVAPPFNLSHTASIEAPAGPGLEHRVVREGQRIGELECLRVVEETTGIPLSATFSSAICLITRCSRCVGAAANSGLVWITAL